MARASRKPRIVAEPAHDFDGVADSVRAHFATIIGDRPLFRVNVGRHDLYEAYLAGLPTKTLRQHHTCSCCRQFISRFGNLGVVNEDGSLTSALWDASQCEEPYAGSVAAMQRIVEKGRIRDIFLTDIPVWGTPLSVGTAWTHFAVAPPATALRRRMGILTAGQQMAEKREDYRILQTAMAEIRREHVEQALTLLRSDALYRSEKVIGPAEFLLRMHDLRKAHRGRALENLTWLAVAGAPTGFCKPRGAMIGTLLEDIASGTLDFAAIKARFADKMHPLRYQRPVAPPSRGTIEQAEKIVAELGLEPALHRRFARFEEVEPHLLWRPQAVVAPAAKAGVFGHLREKESAGRNEPIVADAQKITWSKFAAKVLPGALRMQVYMAHGSLPFFGMTTATNGDAPPILQWDLPGARNPVAWYFYNGGSSPSAWGLTAGAWTPVLGLALKPSMWGGGFEHQGAAAFLIVEGARDKRMADSGGGLCLFPETLRADLHGVRSVVEAHSRTRSVTGADEGSANGLAVPNGQVQIGVTTAIGREVYIIDRWD